MPIANDNFPTPQELAARIRDKVTDLNDELTLAALIELDVEFAQATNEQGSVVDIKVWCSQEVR